MSHSNPFLFSNNLQAETKLLRRDITRTRKHLQNWPVTGKDQDSAMESFRELGWHGLRHEMLGCNFLPNIAAPLIPDFPIPHTLHAAYTAANRQGLGKDFHAAIVAKATFQGVRALCKFYEVIDANACYSRNARVVFNIWAMYNMLDYEAPRDKSETGNVFRGWASIVRMGFDFSLRRTRHEWDPLAKSYREALETFTSWPVSIPDPFWLALVDQENIPAFRNHFEPKRTSRNV